MLFWLNFDWISSQGKKKKKSVVIPIKRNFLQIAKINSLQEKPVIPNRKN